MNSPPFHDFLAQYSPPVNEILSAILAVSCDHLVSHNHSDHTQPVGAEDKTSLAFSVLIHNPLVVRDREASDISQKWFYFDRGGYTFLPLEDLRENLEELVSATSESRTRHDASSLASVGIVTSLPGGSGVDGSFHVVNRKGVWYISNQKKVSPSLSHYVNLYLGLNEDDFFIYFDTIHRGQSVYGGGTRTVFYEPMLAALYSTDACVGIRVGQTIYDPNIPLGRIKVVRVKLKDEIFHSVFPDDRYAEVMAMRRCDMDQYMTNVWASLRTQRSLFPEGKPPSVFDFMYTEILFSRTAAGLHLRVQECPLHRDHTERTYLISP